MPAIIQKQQPKSTTSGSTYSETPGQKAGWAALADWIEEQVNLGLLQEGDEFNVQGFVQSMELDNGRFFSKKIKDRKTGEEKDTTYTKVTAVITDPRFAPPGVLLPLPRKDLGTSFFDGRMRDGSRGIARGAMYHLHLAVTFADPPKELIDNVGTWDTDDYTGPSHPVLLVVTFAGWEDEGSQYFNSRSSLKVFLKEFARDIEGRRAQLARPKAAPAAVTGDEFDEDPTPVATAPGRRARGSAASATASSAPADKPWIDDATDPVGAAAQVLVPPTRGRRAAASAGAAAPAAAASTATAPASPVPVTVGGQKATERQVKFIYAIAREAGLDEQELQNWSQELYNQEVEELNRRDASVLIEALQRRRNEVA